MMTKDKIGIFLGTVIFFLFMPLTLFVSALPYAFVLNNIHSAMMSFTLGLCVFAFGCVVSFISAMILGLSITYSLGWVLGHFSFHMSERSNTWLGIGLITFLAFFFMFGGTPIDSIAKRVETLFPSPLLLSMGNYISLNLSHCYAVTTGYISVCFLFMIVGTMIGVMLQSIRVK